MYLLLVLVITLEVLQGDSLLEGVGITALLWEEPFAPPLLIAVQARRSDSISSSTSTTLSLSLVDLCWRRLNLALPLAPWFALPCPALTAASMATIQYVLLLIFDFIIWVTT